MPATNYYDYTPAQIKAFTGMVFADTINKGRAAYPNASNGTLFVIAAGLTTSAIEQWMQRSLTEINSRQAPPGPSVAQPRAQVTAINDPIRRPNSDYDHEADVSFASHQIRKRPGKGLVWIDLFISRCTEEAHPFDKFRGDCRQNKDETPRFDSNAPIGKTRSRITLNFESGWTDLFTNYTCRYDYWDEFRIAACEDSKTIKVNRSIGTNTSFNSFWIKESSQEVVVQFELWNAAVRGLQPRVAIDGKIRVSFSGNRAKLCYSGDSYPAMEAYQRTTVNGAERTRVVAQEAAGSSWGLVPHIGQREKCYAS